jgi:hypothetical protein
MLAVGWAHAIAARRQRLNTMLAHDPFDPLAADGLAAPRSLVWMRGAPYRSRWGLSGISCRSWA